MRGQPAPLRGRHARALGALPRLQLRGEQRGGRAPHRTPENQEISREVTWSHGGQATTWPQIEPKRMTGTPCCSVSPVRVTSLGLCLPLRPLSRVSNGKRQRGPGTVTLVSSPLNVHLEKVDQVWFQASCGALRRLNKYANRFVSPLVLCAFMKCRYWYKGEM